MADVTSVYSSTISVGRVNSTSGRTEKPWKPYPPKRSASLRKTDVTATSSTSSKGVTDVTDVEACVTPSIVSVIPVDVSGRSFEQLRQQPRFKVINETVPNGVSEPTVARNDIGKDVSACDLSGVREHGFGIRQNHNLRGKNPSRDRWMSAGLNIDPYPSEDEFQKISSRNSGPKPEKSLKSKQGGSFLLCSSRKALRSDLKEASQPYRKNLTNTEVTSHISQSSSELRSKRQSSAVGKGEREFNGRQGSDGKSLKNHLNPTSQAANRSASKSSTSLTNNKEEASIENPVFIPNHKPLFSSIVPSRNVFWPSAKKRCRAKPVSVPRLADDAMKVVGDKLSRTSGNAFAEATIMQLEDVNPVPCSVHFISETERKTERRNEAGSEGKVGCQSPSILSRLRYHEPQTVEMRTASKVHEPRSCQDKTCPQTVLSNEHTEANSRPCQVSRRNQANISAKPDQTMQSFCMMSELPDTVHRHSISIPNQDSASLRSSATSDWFSAHDSSVDHCGSESADLDSSSSNRSSATWLSKVKRLFGAMWTVFLPSTSSRKPSSSPEVDNLSDVDSGCSVGPDHEPTVALQRSPSEMSELQKLAALANRIANERRRGKDSPRLPQEVPSRDAFLQAFSYELAPHATGAAGSGAPRDTRNRSEDAENAAYCLSECPQSSSDMAQGMTRDGKKMTRFSGGILEFPSSNADHGVNHFERSHKSFQENGNYFSNRPFVNSLKVQNSCGKIDQDAANQASDTIPAKKSNSFGLSEHDSWENNTVKISHDLARDCDRFCRNKRMETLKESERFLLEKLSTSTFSEFSVSTELDEAIAMLTEVSNSIESYSTRQFPASQSVPSNSNTARNGFRTAYLLTDDMRNACTQSCASSAVETNIRASSVTNKKVHSADMSVQDSSGRNSGSVVEDHRPENSETCVASDNCIKIYPAYHVPLSENSSDLRMASERDFSSKEANEIWSLGSCENKLSKYKRETEERDETKTGGNKNTDSSNRDVNNCSSGSSSCEKIQNRPRTCAGSPVKNHTLNLSTGSTVAGHIVNDITVLENQIVVQYPSRHGQNIMVTSSPSAQRTRASKMAFFSGDTRS